MADTSPLSWFFDRCRPSDRLDTGKKYVSFVLSCFFFFFFYRRTGRVLFSRSWRLSSRYFEKRTKNDDLSASDSTFSKKHKEFRMQKKKLLLSCEKCSSNPIYRSLSTFDLNRISRNLVVGQIFEKDSYLGEVRYTRESLNSLDARQSDPTFRENRQVAVSKDFPIL